MKGVIRRHTDAELIDVAHDLPAVTPERPPSGSASCSREFPPAVHCAVIDPGVGTDRDALVVRAGSHVLVAPTTDSRCHRPERSRGRKSRMRISKRSSST